MSVTKRGDKFYLHIRPFGGKLISIRTLASNKAEALAIERAVLTACKSGIYSFLEPLAKEACIRLFENQNLEMPKDLGGTQPTEHLTLRRAIEIFLNYPSIRDAKERLRYRCALANVEAGVGEDKPLKDIWVADLRLYQVERVSAGAAPATVNREISSLSKLFGVMVELQYVEVNPCRLVKKLSDRMSYRQVYLARETVEQIVEQCPSWYQPIVWTAYYTGMRRGEIMGLTRRQIDLKKRIITLAPEHTKEGNWKKVPIHRELVPILAEVLSGPVPIHGRVFSMLRDATGLTGSTGKASKNKVLGEIPRILLTDTWSRACRKVGLPDPLPHFHDLRHAWKINARRSGIHSEIAAAIMGHSNRTLTVRERYDFLSDDDLIEAIDRMTFDHGETQVWVAGQK